MTSGLLRAQRSHFFDENPAKCGVFAATLRPADYTQTDLLIWIWYGTPERYSRPFLGH